jgi:hypothetical protein
VIQKIGRKCQYRKPDKLDYKREKYAPPDEMAEATFTPRIGRTPRKSQFRSRSCKALKNALTSWQRKEMLELQECTFQPNLHKSMVPTSNLQAWPQHRPFRRDENGFLRGEMHKPSVAQGQDPRHLPSGDPFLWSLRSKSAEPRPGVPEKPDMQFGETFEHTDKHIAEKRNRDWGSHVRLQCDQLEMIRRPEGDQAVVLFANRFLELRAVERTKRDNFRRECKKNLGFSSAVGA